MSCEGGERLRVLALEPYYGGSHRAFLDQWSVRSRHRLEILGLPARKWKWRMRQAAITFSERLREMGDPRRWDLLLCSDMLNLAELEGLAPRWIRDLPSVVYFHENQLTYPVRHGEERDYHFGLTNLTTALAADSIWFNSRFHRRSFLGALSSLLRKMPDERPLDAVERIRRKAVVQPPGIEPIEPVAERTGDVLRVLWVARWEFDKDPETFFEALRAVRERGVPFRLLVLGQSFRRAPEIFARARQELAECIDVWGYVESRRDYLACLGCADVVVSTAQHEFFGLAVLEAIAAGARPLLPRALSYPELLDPVADGSADSYFYEGGAEVLADRLCELAERRQRGPLESQVARRRVSRYLWPRRADELDDALLDVAERRPAVKATAAKS